MTLPGRSDACPGDPSRERYCPVCGRLSVPPGRACWCRERWVPPPALDADPGAQGCALGRWTLGPHGYVVLTLLTLLGVPPLAIAACLGLRGLLRASGYWP
jgi:hypothetical protein